MTLSLKDHFIYEALICETRNLVLHDPLVASAAHLSFTLLFLGKVELLAPIALKHTQRLQNPLIKEYTINHIRDPIII